MSFFFKASKFLLYKIYNHILIKFIARILFQIKIIIINCLLKSTSYQTKSQLHIKCFCPLASVPLTIEASSSMEFFFEDVKCSTVRTFKSVYERRRTEQGIQLRIDRVSYSFHNVRVFPLNSRILICWY